MAKVQVQFVPNAQQISDNKKRCSMYEMSTGTAQS